MIIVMSVNELVNIFIDTEIWSLAQKEPAREKFSDDDSYKRALDAHQRAKRLIYNSLEKHRIYMSYHQLSELYHVLGFRGSKLPLSHVKEILQAILESKKIVKVPVRRDHIELSMELSARSGIHIWDFLCIVPILNFIDTTFSIDRHFLHPVFKELGVKVKNPLNIWITT